MNTPIEVVDLLRYPVKGLAGESLRRVDVSRRRGVAGDRVMAIAHGSSAFDHALREWVPRRNFVVAAYSPPIVTSSATYDPRTRRVDVAGPGGQETLSASEGEPIGRWLDKLLAKSATEVQRGPYRLAVADEDSSLTDSPLPAVSMMSVSSLASLERDLDCTLDRRRFRGNLWFSGAEPWEEMDWTGRELAVGQARLRVVEPIVRCAAIDVDPDTGRRRLQVLKGLGSTRGHACFGVLAEVIRDGSIAVGDAVRNA